MLRIKEEQIEAMREAIARGLPYNEVAKLVGVSRPTVSRYAPRIKPARVVDPVIQQLRVDFMEAWDAGDAKGLAATQRRMRGWLKSRSSHE